MLLENCHRGIQGLLDIEFLGSGHDTSTDKVER